MLQDRSNKKVVVPAHVSAIVRLMNELIELLSTEPQMVLERKFAEHQKLLKRKQRLILEYRASLKSLSAQPELLRQLPDEAKRILKTTAQKLSEVAERNARALRAAVTAVQRLIQNIIAHVKGEVLRKPGYKNPKTAYLELGKYSPTCKPVAVRRSA